MMEDDPLFYWRLSDHVSVEDAAILIAGGDPSAVDEVYFEGVDSLQREEVKRTDGHPGFVATFTGLKTAVRLGRLKAVLEYRVYNGFQSDRKEPYWALPQRWLTDPSKFEFDFVDDGRDSVFLAKEPDWSRTMLDVRDLKVWLQERGIKTGFFFPASQADEDDFMDPSHDHFAPELAMAVAAWRALSQTQKLRQSPKAAIDGWITSNPSVWQGEGEISASAKERIATVANWNRSGGANPTGG
ncbi:hypothetical protein [Tabrizicola sp. BL-A-41-H6]|uniref:hypothetical protein n=1 Tax=Tabrizicola sp. BL-A-41-H6 TaxID=3421107 RepID=UPI003D67FAE5